MTPFSRKVASMLRVLLRRYPVRNWARGRHPFDVLVSIVLSQATTDVNADRAMRQLRKLTRVTPKDLALFPVRKLARAIRVAGLSKQKAPRIQALAKEVIRRYGGDLLRLRNLDTKEARRELRSLTGIGPKTADVWLNLVLNREVVPLDTHIWRVSRRWGFRTKDYDRLSEKLAHLLPGRRRQQGHLAIIAFGREYCQARRPRCLSCPLADGCPSRKRFVNAGRAKV